MSNAVRAALLASTLCVATPAAADTAPAPPAAPPQSGWLASLGEATWGAISGVVSRSTGARLVRDASDWVETTYTDYQEDRRKAEERRTEARIAREDQRLRDQGYSEGQIAAVRAFAADEDRQLAGLDDPDNGVFEQGARVADGRAFVGDFDGFASGEDGDINYRGFRRGGYIIGSFRGPDGAGDFAGAITRSNRVTGTYVLGPELGVFAGQATPTLDRVFDGGTQCRRGCEGED